MPNYPAHYYYKAPSSTSAFAYDGEDICIDELLQDKEKVYYDAQPSGEETSPKRLIFNDWSAENWTPYHKLQRKMVLRDLLNNQFPVYYHKLGQWIPFSLKKLDLLLDDYQAHIVASDNDLLRTAAIVPLNTPLNNLLCLDYFELNHLIDENYDPSSKIVFSSDMFPETWARYPAQRTYVVEQLGATIVEDGLDMETDKIPDTAIRHLKIGGYRYGTPGPALRLVEESSRQAVMVLGQDAASAPKAVMVANVKTVEISQGNELDTPVLRTMFGSEPNQIESLKVTGHDGRLSALGDFGWSKLKMFHYEAGYHGHGRNDKANNEYILSNILPNATDLVHLSVALNYEVRACHFWRFGSTALESFTLSGTWVSPQEIFTILEQNPKLDRLHVTPYMKPDDDCSPRGKQRHALKKLCMSEANTMEILSGGAFQALLEYVPDLQELEFRKPRFSAYNDFLLAPNALPGLKHLAFPQSNPGIDYCLEKCLPRLLKAAPNLETLEFWPGTVLPQISLPKLKKVSWFGRLSPERLNSFVACAVNLDSITFLYHIQDGDRKIIWRPSDFEKLPFKEIDLCSWGDRKPDEWHGASTAEAIIRQSPKLEKIRITDPENAPIWLKQLCIERTIALEPTAYFAKGSEVKKDTQSQPEPASQSAPIEAVDAVVHRQQSTQWMNRYFQRATEDVPHTLDSYLQSLTTGEGRNQLVYLKNRLSLNALMLHLEQYCEGKEQPVYPANEPKDLICSSRYMKREGDVGRIRPGPGGKMVVFLANKARGSQLPAIIIVNQDNFEAADNGRFNPVFDPPKVRKAGKDVPIPESAIVLVLMNLENPNTYAKADLLSRFAPKYRKHCPLPDDRLLEGLPQITQAPKGLPADTASIEFFGQENWRARMDGRWIMGEQFHWQEGVSSDALHSGSSLVLKNLEVEDPNFQWYWARTLLNHNRETGQIVTTYAASGYDWEVLNQALEWSDAETMTAPFLLNGRYLSKFFKHYESEDPKMIYADGLVETLAGQTIDVYQTGPISLGNKARLLAECLKYDVKIRLSEGPFSLLAYQASVTLTTDIDYSLESLFGSADIVIDISECEAAQLLGKTVPTYDDHSQKYTFQTSPSFLRTNLAAGKHVVLKGQFTQALVDSLASFLLFQHALPGFLSLVTTPDSKFDFCAGVVLETVDKEDKKRALYAKYPTEIELVDRLLANCPDNEPYVRLNQRMRYMLRQQRRGVVLDHPNLYEFSQKNWDGLEKLSERASDREVDDVMAQRGQELESILADEQMVVVLGKTGGGKTEFMKRRYPDAHYGLSKISTWLAEGQRKPSKLVMDEATIAKSNWTMFEGLPHSMFWNGKYHQLNKNHQVIFIGNPYSDGGERRLATLFLRHGNTCIFDPLTAKFIGQDILEPLFAGTQVEPTAVLPTILYAYDFIARLPSHSVLVTPRELCTMTLLSISTKLAVVYQDVPPQDIACFFAYYMTKALVYEQHPRAFLHAFPAKPVWEPTVEHTIASDDFLLTDSRKIVLQLLEAFVRLRHFKQAPNRTKEQKISGLAFFVLEGEPAQGKTVLLDSVLSEENPVYLSTITDPEKRTQPLLDAFRTGRAVRMDEMNTVALSEQDMNTIMSGYDFETNEMADESGFMGFVSQNPITLDGRRAMTNAEARRAFTWKLENYTVPELCKIAEHHGMSGLYAETFVNKFMREVHTQKVHDETPWTVRELIALVKDVRKDSVITIQTQFRRYHQRGTLQEMRRAEQLRWQELQAEQLQQQALQAEQLRQQELQAEKQQQRLQTQKAKLTASRQNQGGAVSHGSQNAVPVAVPSNRSPAPTPPPIHHSWLIRFLPELTGALLFLAGVALLMSAGSVGLAVGLMAAGVGLFAVGRVRAWRAQEEPLGRAPPLTA
ncbi:MAG: hypothetical protein NTU48_03465 [Legionellales bacterium]|nr:hypothetical protein [Legionellales bacterium]